MHNLLIYSNLIIGAWMIFTALIMNTGNVASALIFKVIPFFAGAVLIFNGLKLLNII